MFYKTANSLFCIHSLGSIHAHIRALIPAPTSGQEVNQTLTMVAQIKQNVQSANVTMAQRINVTVQEELNTTVTEPVSVVDLIDEIAKHEGITK